MAIFWLSGLAVLLALSPAGSAFAAEGPDHSGLDAARSRAMDALFAPYNRPAGPGAAVGIYQEGRLIFARGYGMADLEHHIPVTPQTRFHVASMTKQFTAFSIALLAREGKVDLEADIRRYLAYVPDFGHRITVNELLHHTSGLRNQSELFRLGGQDTGGLLHQQQVVNLVARQRGLNFEPGSDILYSNTGYALLAEIVHAVSGRTFRQFTAERIFRPLGMTRTFVADNTTEIIDGGCAQPYAPGETAGTWRRDPLNFALYGSTGMVTTVEDLTAWVANFSRPTVGDQAMIRQITTMGTLADGSPINYGFGLWRDNFAGHEAIMHSGADAGFRSVMAYFPRENFAVAIFVNTPSDLLAPVSAATDLWLNGWTGAARNSLPSEIELDAASLAQAQGHYLPATGEMITLELKGGRLTWNKIGSKPQTMHFRADGTFDFGAKDSRIYRLRRETGGDVSAIVEKSGLGGPLVIDRKIEPSRPSTAELNELAGDYRCPEVDATYTLAVENGSLTARSLWLVRPVKLEPVVAGRFESGEGPLGVIIFHRDALGRPTGFEVNNGRILHVMLEKVGPGISRTPTS